MGSPVTCNDISKIYIWFGSNIEEGEERQIKREQGEPVYLRVQKHNAFPGHMHVDAHGLVAAHVAHILALRLEHERPRNKR